MELVEIIERARVEHPELELHPPPPPSEIDALETELGVRLPHVLRVLLERTGGIDGGPLGTIDFTGRSFDVEVREIFPSGLPIAHDGSGSPDLGHFLTEIFLQVDLPRASLIDDVHSDRLFRVWRENPGALPYEAALEGDEELRAFAATLDDRYLIVDLRAPKIGMGFSWGRYGPATEIRRHGYRGLFAYAPPERRPGLLRRVFR